MYEPTESKVPLRDRDQPVVLSGSALDQLANTCALQWFLGREVKADAPATAAQGFGNVVHVLADEVASGRTPADLAVLMERLDSVWNALAFDAPWKSAQEKEHARVALERFLTWHVMDRTGRTPVASEHDFDVTLEAGDYEVRIRGSMDRVEADGEGRAYVVDFKTGKQAPTAAEVRPPPPARRLPARRPRGRRRRRLRRRAPRTGRRRTRPAAPGRRQEGRRRDAAQGAGAGAARGRGGRRRQGEWIGDLLATAAGKVLDERFTPTGAGCEHCAPAARFRRVVQRHRPEGRQRGRVDVRLSVAAASLSDVPARITDPEQLKELLGIPFTPEQTACITAPPAPQVIVAGAGSGKTTVMAARVVWLVGTGQVAPEQVLGLTFTNKAAGELAERVRKALVKAGVTDPDVIDPDNPPGEPRHLDLPRLRRAAC